MTIFKRADRLTIAIAPDSFKGALAAGGVAEAMAAGFKQGLPGVTCRLIPMADGGEGTVTAWAAATGAALIEAEVHDPLGRLVVAQYGRDDERHLAVIEMAAASGLPLLTLAERNPLLTSTYGTGELIRHALDHGVRHILLGIGGSATNDGGSGMATALGYRLLDSEGVELPPGGGALSRLHRIDSSACDPRLADVEIEVACDVTNRLCGPAGASEVYGPQKGATAAMVRQLDSGLARLAEVVAQAAADFPVWQGRAAGGREVVAPVELAQVPGAGAAGGLGFGLMAFCGARLARGVELVAQAVQLEERLKGADLVVTGEGRLDGQTIYGKTPVGVAAVAQRLAIPVIAICGCLGEGYEAVHQHHIAALFPVAHGHFDPADLACGARERITACALEVARLLAL